MKMRLIPCLGAFLICPSLLAFADSVTLNTNANQLAAAVTSGNTGVTVTSATLQGQTLGAAASTGTFTNIYGLGSGAVISNGNAANYGSGPNNALYNTTDFGTTATASENALLNPLTNGFTSHYDVTELDLKFTVASNIKSIFFNVAFGSEEYPKYVGSKFVDAFGLYLNGKNIAFADNQAINIDNTCFKAFAGTELNGVLACGNQPINTLSGDVVSGINTLTFIIADTSDHVLDTTAYIGALGTKDVTPPAISPEPSSLGLLGTGLLTMVGAVRRRFRRA